jgi:hypothetical protein
MKPDLLLIQSNEQTKMSCHQSNYSIPVGSLVADQSLSFETHGTITVTFTAPTNERINWPTFVPASPPTGYPIPTTTIDSITFSDPQGGTTDFDVNVPYTGGAQLGLETPSTTIKFKPRSSCPTG